MDFPDFLSNGSPEFMLALAALIVGLIQSQTVADSGIARHPCVCVCVCGF